MAESLAVESRPFAGYHDFAACEAANQGKVKDTGAYCATIMRAVEGKDIDWLVYRPWHNERIMEVFINDARKDFEGEKYPLQAQIAAMPWFMENGFYEWFHGTDTGETPVPIGKPLAWRVRDGLVEVRFGIWDSKDVGHPWIDERWKIMQEEGTRGTVSVTFAPIGPKHLKSEGYSAVLEIPKAWMWSVGWVGPFAASPGATVNFVSNAKALDSGAELYRSLLGYYDALERFGPQFKAVLSKSGSLGTVDINVTVSPEALKALNGASEPRGPDMVDIDLGTFIEQLGITELKAEGLLKSCAPCGSYVTDLEAKGVPHEVAIASLQKKLDDMVAEKRAKAAKKGGSDAGADATAKAKLAEIDAKITALQQERRALPGQEGEQTKCPDGYKPDPDGNCVPEEPKVSEEGLKAMQNEMAAMRQMMARVLKERISEQPGMKALKTTIPAALEGAPDDIRTKVMTLVDAAMPNDIETQIKSFQEDFEKKMRNEMEEIAKERIGEFSGALETVQKQLKIPATKPRGATDVRGGTAFQASSDRALLKALNKSVKKLGGDT